MSNPFKTDTRNYRDYETLKDLKWHCAVCELEAGQAKTWQNWRDEHGIQFEKGKLDGANYSKSLHCNNCNHKRTHRKLLTLEISETTSIRTPIKPTLAKRIKTLLGNREAFWNRKIPPRMLEVDHKFPQTRWNEDEESYDNATDEKLIEKFILLTRSNNLLKSRNCERCVVTNKRGRFPGIEYWYEGDEEWRKEPHDEQGCIGCFWYDPDKWKEELNKLVTLHKIVK
jgi:hypothetical protein